MEGTHFRFAARCIGCWTIDGYNIFKTTVVIVIGKSDEGPNQVDLKRLKILKDTEIQVGGRPARRIDFQNKNEPGGTVLPYSQARGIGVMMKAPEADGKYLTLVFVSTPDQWDKLSPLFEASLQSITLDGKGGSSTESNTIKTVFVEFEKERPLTGATVIIGRQLHLIPVSQVPTGDFGSGISSIVTGGPIDMVRGEAIFQIRNDGRQRHLSAHGLTARRISGCGVEDGPCAIPELEIHNTGRRAQGFCEPRHGPGNAEPSSHLGHQQNLLDETTGPQSAVHLGADHDRHSHHRNP
jgi:hypothetical protein